MMLLHAIRSISQKFFKKHQELRGRNGFVGLKDDIPIEWFDKSFVWFFNILTKITKILKIAVHSYLETNY